MELNESQTSFEQALKRLQTAPPLSWPERQRLAVQIGQRLRTLGSPEFVPPAVRLLRILVEDEKWEVRKAVAESLVYLPTAEFDVLISDLGDDSNLFVRRAAERALRRRKRQERAEGQKRQKLEGVFDEYNWFVSKYGRGAADRALQIGERYFEVLASAATHEIRGVLTSLMAALDRLGTQQQAGQLGPSEFQEQLTTARRRAEFLNRITDDFKGYAQSISCQFRRESLRSIVEEAIALLPDKLRSEGGSLDALQFLNLVPDSLVLDASRHQLVQVFTNVIRNAVEAGKGGRVEINATLKEDGRIEATVVDYGVGMSESEIRDAFVPFKTSKRNQGGTGFGLPIARKLVNAHGGTIEIHSQEDQGTTVTIRLPASQDKRLDE